MTARPRPEADLTEIEKSLFSSAELKRDIAAGYVLQAILSVDPHCPHWCDMTWLAYGKCLHPWRADRIGSPGDAPAFYNIEHAIDAVNAARKAHRGKMRFRVIHRGTITIETLVNGDGR